jgi:hypothetical protein
MMHVTQTENEFSARHNSREKEKSEAALTQTSLVKRRVS